MVTGFMAIGTIIAVFAIIAMDYKKQKELEEENMSKLVALYDGNLKLVMVPESRGTNALAKAKTLPTRRMTSCQTLFHRPFDQ